MGATNPKSAAPLRRRRRLQFSLRTLLVFVLLASVGMSWLAVALQRAREQRDAVAAIEKLGGSVAYDYQLHESGDVIRNAQPPWLRAVLGSDFFSRVAVVQGSTESPMAEADLGLFKGLPELQRLHLGSTRVTDTGLERLKGLTQLRELALLRSDVTDAGLEHLKGMSQLERLYLSDSRVSDAGLDCLARLSKLQVLSLDGTQVTDAGLEHLKGLTDLRELGLNCTRVTGAGLRHLGGLRQLWRLHLKFTQVTDAGLEDLKYLPQLQELFLSSTELTDAGLEHVRGLRQLQRLSVGRVDDEGAIRITDEGIKRLQQALPNCFLGD